MKHHSTSQLGTRLCASVAVWLSVTIGLAQAAVPAYRPADDHDIVLRVGGRNTESKLAAFRQAVRNAPQDPAALARYVDGLIALGRNSGHERYYGYAEQAIKVAPQSVQVALTVEHAHLLQQRHDFLGAEALLNELLAREPRRSEARLMRAQIRFHLNFPEQAMRDCVALMPHVDLLTSTTCFAQARAALAQSIDDVSRAYELLVAALKSAHAPSAARSWGAGVAAELAARLKRNDEASKWFRLAFSLDTQSHYPRIALADWLLSQGQDAEALEVARGGSSNADQLRVVIAGRDLHSPAAKRLQLDWQEAAAKGERNHLRDQARFELLVLRDAKRAHASALDNFSDHREIEDGLLLAATARAKGDKGTLGKLQSWSAERNYIDARIGDMGDST